MSEKYEQKLKEYLQQSNIKMLFEGKSPQSTEITNLSPAFSDIGGYSFNTF